MRPSLVLCLAGAAAAATIALAIAISSSDPAPGTGAPGVAGPRPPPASSARSPEAPRPADASDASLDGWGGSPPTSAAAGSAGAAASAEAEADASADAVRQLEAERARQVALIEAAVRGPRDAWAIATEPELGEQFRAFLAAHRELGLRLTEVRCSARLCRIELASPDAERAAEGLAAVAQLMPWRGERLMRAAPGERPTLVVFAAREHTPLVAALE